MAAYYNEFKPEAAHMLRQLISDGIIADGEVDERSITEVTADDIKGFTQCHFFAGIGGWSVALRSAGWADDRPVWTGSCPCQPFSTAGKQKGKEDERHLWPIWSKLIAEIKPSTIFGEQVSSAISHGWLDGVYSDLEAEGYAVGAAVLPACSVNAPHKRDRLWFVADTQSERGGRTWRPGQQAIGGQERDNSVQFGGASGSGSLGDGAGSVCQRDAGGFLAPEGRERSAWEQDGNLHLGSEHASKSNTERTVAVGHSAGLQGHGRPVEEYGEEVRQEPAGHNTTLGLWDEYGWLLCGDGKIRRVPTTEPDVRRLADGLQPRTPQEYADSLCIVTSEKVQGRTHLLHGLGNAIVPSVAAGFIRSFMLTSGT